MLVLSVLMLILLFSISAVAAGLEVYRRTLRSSLLTWRRSGPAVPPPIPPAGGGGGGAAAMGGKATPASRISYGRI